MSAAKSHPRYVSSLEDHLGYWLRLVSNNVSAGFARRLEALDVSVSEWVAMRKLFDQPGAISISALAEQMGMTKAPVSRLVERLVQKELVYRQDSRERWTGAANLAQLCRTETGAQTGCHRR